MGECYELIEDMNIWENPSPNSYIGRYLIHQYIDEIADVEFVMAGSLPAGSKLRLEKFLLGSNGSFGSYLRIRVKIVEGDLIGIEADVPACVPYHPQPIWLSTCELNPSLVQLDSSIVARCLE